MSPDRVKELIIWARGHGTYLHEQIEVFEDLDFGISLRVKSSDIARDEKTDSCLSEPRRGTLPAESRIVSCPFRISLSYLNALDTYSELKAHSFHFPQSLFEALEPHVIGHFFLVQQYLNLKNSYWSPYIRSLPQPDKPDKLCTPLYFSEEDLTWIRGTDLEAATEQRQHVWKSNWERGSRILDDTPGWEEWRGRWTWQLYKWAATIFSSRSFTSRLVPDEIFVVKAVGEQANELSLLVNRNHTSRRPGEGEFPVLFPVVDLANHSSDTKVTWFSNVNTEPKDLSIIVDSEIPEGRQIFNNYGPKNNAELLLGYGFCALGNDEIAIAFKTPAPELMAIRARHLAFVKSHAIDGRQSVFHIRKSGYNTSQHDRRLLDFRTFENGCVDSLTVLVANERELEFIRKYPFYCMEASAEDVFASQFGRNMLKIISVLEERLKKQLDKIVSAGADLCIPENPRQWAAKLYRDGQISTLNAALSPIKARLDAATCQHTFCTHTAISKPETPRFTTMQSHIELLTLECAFNWLESLYPTHYGNAVEIIKRELDLETTQPIDWKELIAADWDFALWCFWLYLIVSSYPSENSASMTFPGKLIMNWIGHILELYAPNTTFSAFQTFHGENDESETVRSMVSQLYTRLEGLQKEQQEGVDGKKYTSSETSQELINFASVIVTEEGLRVSVRGTDANTDGKLMQKVLCLNKFPDEESRKRWKAAPEVPKDWE